MATDEITRSAVFNPPQVVWGRMQEECTGPNSVECVASIMRQAGASPEAIAFSRKIDGDGYMDSFREMGKVDLVSVFYPFRANTNGGSFLVNGSPSMISLEELDKWGKVDIRKDPLYPAIAKRFPEVMLWGGEPGFGTMQRLPSGGQRFIFSYVLLNGCHACDVAGYAHVAFDFDRNGRFSGTKLLRLSRPARTRHQHAVKKTRRGPRSGTPSNTTATALPLIGDLEGGLLNISPSGEFVATQIERAGNNYTTKIWKPNEGRPLLVIEGRFGSFSPDNRFVMTSYYTSDWKQVFELYEIASVRRLNSWQGWQFAGFSPDSKSIIADGGYIDGKPLLEFWSIERSVRTRSFRNKAPVFSHDGTLMIFGDDGDTGTTIVGASNGRPLRQFEGKFVWFSADDQLIATKANGVLKIWKTSSGELLSETECWGDAYLSPDGEVVATEVYDHRRSKENSSVRLAEARTGRALASIDGRLLGPSALVNGPFSKNGGLIATDVTNQNRSATKIWEIRTGHLVTSVEGGFHGLSSDGRTLMTGVWWKRSGHTTKLWRAEDGALVADLEGYPIAFSPDNQLVFTGSKTAVKVWRLR